MVFRKLRNLVLRQAQAAASKETANNQPSPDDKQPEPILFRSLALYQQQLKFMQPSSQTKVTREKDRFPKAKQRKLPSVLLLTKSVKGENKTQDSPDPFKLMMN